MDKKNTLNIRWKEFLTTAAAVVLLFGVGYAAAGMLGHNEFIGSTRPSGGDQANYIGSEAAKEIALSDALSIEKRDILTPKELRSKLVESGENVYYDVVISFEDAVYDYDIDAESGSIKNIRVDRNRSTLDVHLYWKSARDAAFNHAGFGLNSITQLEIEYDSDECIYDIEFRDQKFAYDYEIDGYTGRILQLKVETDDDKDPLNTPYESRQYSIDVALKAAGVPYDEVTLLRSSSDYESHPKVRNIYFEAGDSKYTYVLYMDSQTVKFSEVTTPDIVMISREAALTEALNANALDINHVSELSFELKTSYDQLSSVGKCVYIVNFTAYDDQYEVTVDGLTGNVVKTKKKANATPSQGKDIAPGYQCANAAIEHAGISKGKLIYLSTVFEINGSYYSVDFKTTDKTYTYTVDGKTKQILSSTPPVQTIEPDKQIGSENAIAAALADLGIQRSNVMYETVSLEEDDGSWYYEVSFWYDGYIYECDVNAVSGEVSEWDKVESAPASVDLLLDEQDSRQIRKAFLETFVSEADRGNYTIDDLSIRYFGSYEDAMVMFVDGILGYNDVETGEIVSGIRFQYPSSQRLLVYYEDKFMTLSEAYDEDALEHEDIILLKHHFDAA